MSAAELAEQRCREIAARWLEARATGRMTDELELQMDSACIALAAAREREQAARHDHQAG